METREESHSSPTVKLRRDVSDNHSRGSVLKSRRHWWVCDMQEGGKERNVDSVAWLALSKGTHTHTHASTHTQLKAKTSEKSFIQTDTLRPHTHTWLSLSFWRSLFLYEVFHLWLESSKEQLCLMWISSYILLLWAHLLFVLSNCIHLTPAWRSNSLSLSLPHTHTLTLSLSLFLNFKVFNQHCFIHNTATEQNGLEEYG